MVPLLVAPLNDNDYHSAMQQRQRNRPAGTDRPGKPLKVRDLMRHGPVLELDHEGQIYRLRITRNRKLILTK